MPNIEKNLNSRIKKNILDLEFQKYLIIASTSIVILFTFLTGVALAFLVKDMSFSDLDTMVPLSIISLIVIVPCIVFFVSSIKHIGNILKLTKTIIFDND